MKNRVVIWFFVIQLLTSCSLQTPKDNAEDFRSFLVDFSTKSDFQINRIVFPLEYVTLTEDLDATQKSLIKREDWKMENLFYGKACTEIYPQVYDNFEMKLKESGERVLAWRGIENGIAVFYFFKLFDGKWFLVKKEDSST